MNTKQSVALFSTSALAAGVAQGAVVTSGPLNAVQTWGPVDHRQMVDMNGDTISDFAFGFEMENNGSYPQKPYVDVRTSMGSFGSNSGLVNLLCKTNAGFPVTPGGTMIDGSYSSLYPVIADDRGYMYNNDQGNAIIGDWSGTQMTDAYVGILFGATGDEKYGWLRFMYDPVGNPASLTLMEWAYDSTPGVGIQTPVIPEPATGALAGLGLASLLIMRRRH
jgi:hypothetical protein